MDPIIVSGIFTAIAIVFILAGIRIVRPTERALVERFGKYNHFAGAGLNWLIPGIDKIVRVNITEMMIDAESQEIITKDRLNATVDAQVYFKVRSDEKSVKDSQYNVYNYKYQIVNLGKTTLRNIIGTMSYEEANSNRNQINEDLRKVLEKEAKPWGIDILRTELKQINPPKQVQESMNMVITAENQKKAAVDTATATETKADGEKRAAVKMAEGQKQSMILKAEGEAQAKIRVAQAEAQKIQLENQALQKYFKNEAVVYQKLKTAERAMKHGTKYVIDSKSNIMNVMSDVAAVPIGRK